MNNLKIRRVKEKELSRRMKGLQLKSIKNVRDVMKEIENWILPYTITGVRISVNFSTTKRMASIIA